MTPGIVWAGGAVLAIYAVICVAAYAFQERLVWFPEPLPDVTPEALGLVYEDAAITTTDGVALHGWYLAGGPKAVLISHGNGGTIANKLELIAMLRAEGHAVLAYDYRGYGKSAGAPTEGGTYRDAEAAYHWLREHGFGAGEIVAYGESLGGAIAIALAARREVGALVVESTFTSLPDAGQAIYPFLPVRLLSRIQYDSMARVPKIQVPILVIHSPEDRTIPFVQGRKLYEAIGTEKEFLKTTGGHAAGGFLLRPEWRAVVADFIAR